MHRVKDTLSHNYPSAPGPDCVCRRQCRAPNPRTNGRGGGHTNQRHVAAVAAEDGPTAGHLNAGTRLPYTTVRNRPGRAARVSRARGCASSCDALFLLLAMPCSCCCCVFEGTRRITLCFKVEGFALADRPPLTARLLASPEPGRLDRLIDPAKSVDQLIGRLIGRSIDQLIGRSIESERIASTDQSTLL